MTRKELEGLFRDGEELYEESSEVWILDTEDSEELKAEIRKFRDKILS